MSDIESIFNKYNLQTSSVDLDNIQWKTQDSNQSSILFYTFNNFNEEEIKNFHERLKNCDFGICITNNSKVEAPSIFGLDNDLFLKFRLEMIKCFYPIDQEKFKLFGVTGTNGKTTTVDLLRQILVQKNIKVLTLGTLGLYLNDKFLKTFSLTTPSLVDIYKVIAEFQNQVDVIAVEVSSHALDQSRFGDMKFDDIGWTNLTQDHLDYHETMEEYFQAKLKIFKSLKSSALCYIPSEHGKLINDIPFDIVEVKNLWPSENLFLKPLYNQQNLAIAMNLAKSVVNIEKVDLDKIKAPPGRFNIINYKNSYIVIDFAHSPDGLEAISNELKTTFPNKKIITIFGCGGDRDRAKRKLMGQAASKYSDKVILTSDNPRFEDPLQIIKDIEPGMSCEYDLIVDRSKAIKQGMEKLENSVLLIAGKGHEDYIDQKGIKTKYNDYDEVNKYIND